MIKYLFLLIFTTIIFLNSCSNGQNKTSGQTKVFNLSAIAFSEKIKQIPTASIVDVRTPGEFNKGHIENAKNINWNGEDFENQITKLDKTLPVFVYCHSGNRSAAAASNMRSLGFIEVYELNGGMMKWRAANLPETTSNSTTNTSIGMSKLQYDQLLVSDKLVLIDFYAEWCAPCKKMKPFLDEISNEMPDKVKVVRIDADVNKELTKELKVDALPTLLLYKNKALTWTNIGYASKEDILKQLK